MSAKGRPERELHPLGGQRAKRAWGSIPAKGRPERELHPLGGQRRGASRERGGRS